MEKNFGSFPPRVTHDQELIESHRLPIDDDAILAKARTPLRVADLYKAAALTDGARNKDYGHPVENHEQIARLASEMTGKSLSASDVVLVQMATKLARMRVSPLKEDHYHDLMAYTGILHECREAEDRK